MTSSGERGLRRCDELLQRAAQTTDMAERGRLIDEAAWLRFKSDETGDSPMNQDLDDLIAIAPHETSA